MLLFNLIGVLTRIISNSYLNVFQKLLINYGAKSSVVNFYSYLGLAFIGIVFCRNLADNCSFELFLNVVVMGILGALGNYFIVKALSIGELSLLAPINSYKPIVAMILGYFILGEIPTKIAIFGILLIILGTYFLHFTFKSNNIKAILYRILALILSGAEAIFIKKVILLTGINNTFFLWAISGLIFSFIFLLFTKHKLKIVQPKYQILLIFLIAIMQYSTNFVFSKMNVAYALALFQLSTIVSIFLGVNLFKEENLLRKLLSSLIMIIGAIIIILN